MPPSDLVTTAEAARRLGVTAQTIRDWSSKGLIAYVQLPSGVKRYRVSDIDAIREPHIGNGKAAS